MDFFVCAVAFGFEFAGFLTESVELVVEFVSFFDELLGFFVCFAGLFVEVFELLFDCCVVTGSWRFGQCNAFCGWLG